MNELNSSGPKSFELPQPMEPAANPESTISSGANPEVGPTSLTVPPALVPPVDPSQLAQPINPGLAQDDSAGSVQLSDDLDAHDLDVIEKAWVEKAKEIVEKTSNDPHEQKDQLSTFSAEYLKKRYNKDIKTEN